MMGFNNFKGNFKKIICKLITNLILLTKLIKKFKECELIRRVLCLGSNFFFHFQIILYLLFNYIPFTLR